MSLFLFQWSMGFPIHVSLPKVYQRYTKGIAKVCHRSWGRSKGNIRFIESVKPWDFRQESLHLWEHLSLRGKKHIHHPSGQITNKSSHQQNTLNMWQTHNFTSFSQSPSPEVITIFIGSPIMASHESASHLESNLAPAQVDRARWHGDFHKCGYPNSRMVYIGKSNQNMDDDWGTTHFRKPPNGIKWL